jgi:hypothetical protein
LFGRLDTISGFKNPVSSGKTYPPLVPREYVIAPLVTDPSEEASPRISPPRVIK